MAYPNSGERHSTLSRLVGHICRRGGEVGLTDLFHQTKQKRWININNIQNFQRFLNDHPEIFHITVVGPTDSLLDARGGRGGVRGGARGRGRGGTARGGARPRTGENANRDQLVSVKTNLAVCVGFASKKGCQDPQCIEMHVCKFFLQGTCKRKEEDCRYGHDIGTDHNQRALNAHCLGQLGLDELRRVFGHTRSTVAYPKWCKFYNAGDGCTRDRCVFLHICKHYLMDVCNFKNNCKRSHDIYSPQCKTVLEKNHINIDRNPKDVLKLLREGLEGCTLSEEMDESGPSQPAAAASTPRRNSSTSSLQNMRLTSGNELSDGELICGYLLRGKCYYGNACRRQHKNHPFQWQFKFKGDWQDFSQSSSIEINDNFAKPETDVCYTTTYMGNREDILEINFSTMSFKSKADTIVGDVRRLSTESSVAGLDSHKLTTLWHWYWLDDSGTWVRYGEKNDKGMSSDLTEDEIEKRYLANPNDALRFSTGHHKYDLKFTPTGIGMKQKNVNEVYFTERDVKRRPDVRNIPGKIAKHSQDTPRGSGETASNQDEVPSHWSPSTTHDDDFTLVNLSSTSDEYKKVEKHFKLTMAGSTINKISRVQNLELWESFIRKRKWMQRNASKKGDTTVDERLLFHGTQSKYLEAISQQGFDWRVSGSSVGTVYGKGSYFAPKASFSDRYTNDGSMFLVKVLVGKYTKGNSSFVKPPPRDPQKPFGALYDSCVDNMQDPNMFIIFTQEQAYPEYIIRFT
ncbi:unnamed protein product [Owenia fusiformis]|uniref:Uncharacterized protein n=1 Tax=Owenia fusiformis TaxID=6347 RepID=A0A8J1TD92_OWEFU|nr:unnamed protein product [Owenia fusiformis]